ncbi:MAG: 5-(carboxyamino)imidazole ribonucleotide mutase [Candidatus Latescibacteria bacterium]|nr:5-(carboxyamino)imidazole ribonucleotide mutase [Candidatus Latescibacterota bacterium]
MSSPIVGILMGSESDRAVMEETAKMLERFGVPYEVIVSSAHRHPKRTREYVQSAADRGIKVIIAGAGMAAHLPGVLASETTLPVIGVPLPGSALNGVDSLYSIVQMPAGVPVAAMAIGTHGAKNAAIFAVEILALADPELRQKLADYRADWSRS